jgi:secondary thiamine-phosphate synthase enzyme
MSNWFQKEIVLKPRSRGFHLITREVMGQLPELSRYQVGLAHFLLMHTSASLSLNENADPSVRQDFESHFDRSIPENAPHYVHTDEGPDDMPAHLKSSTLGVSLMVPISDGVFCLGTWQGIYLGEHRDHGGSRRLMVTLQGE